MLSLLAVIGPRMSLWKVLSLHGALPGYLEAVQCLRSGLGSLTCSLGMLPLVCHDVKETHRVSLFRSLWAVGLDGGTIFVMLSPRLGGGRSLNEKGVA